MPKKFNGSIYDSMADFKDKIKFIASVSPALVGQYKLHLPSLGNQENTLPGSNLK